MPEIKDLTGKTLSDRYEILRPLGEGGMGKVYLAKDKRFGKQVVVKVPTMEVGDKDFKDRFMREIVSVATLEHPHIVTTIDWGELDGIPFMVLNYLAGGNLRDRITDAQGNYKRMPIEGLIQWLPQIASALDYIHSKNWVHRDLKPDNILFDETGNPYLADFGIAKALEGTTMGVKTTMGAFLGTPQYMAPEMHLGKGIGPKADQFGLAVLVYEALAGKIPFAGATPTAIFVEVIEGKAKPIHELVPDIPVEKSNALMKGITKEPEDRYGSCKEFANAVMVSMLSRGISSGSNETPSKPEITGTRLETPSKPVIEKTRIETPSKPIIDVEKLVVPVKPVILPTPTGERNLKEEMSILNPEFQSFEGRSLILLCQEIIYNGEFSKKNLVSLKEHIENYSAGQLSGTLRLKEKYEQIIKSKSISKEISGGIVVLAGGILKEANFPVEEASGLTTEKEIEFNNEILMYAGLFLIIFLLIIILFFSSTNLNADKEDMAMAAKMERLKQEAVARADAAEMERLKLEAVAKANAAEMKRLKEEGLKAFGMVLIPSGKFVMGSPEGEKDQGNDEDQHEVTITKPFYMGKYEVTQEQWESVMGSNPSDTMGASLPVNAVSWNDCQEFIKKLNEKNKGGYRLPTEAEWEYAARAGTKTAYSFGDSITPQDANYSESKIGKPVVVGSYKANAFGLYDMHGNVWEWCEDRKAEYPKDSVTNPKGSNFGENRVLRGGSFSYLARHSRSAVRVNDLSPDVRNSLDVGFRLARTP